MTRRLSHKKIRNNTPKSDALKDETAKRKQAEAQLREALENFNAIFENSPDGLMVIDAIDGTILKANRMVSHLFGYKFSELKGKNFKILFPSRKQLSQRELLKEPHVFGTVFTQEFRHADGATRFMDMTSSIVSMDHGLSILAAFRDISKRVRMEKRLRESRQKYLQLYELVRLITDHASDFIWAKDLKQKFLFVNRAMSEKLLNCDNPQDAIGKTEAFIIDWNRDNRSGKTIEKMIDFSDNVIETPEKTVKYLKEGIIRGKYLVLDVLESPIFNEKRQIIGTVGIGRDITQQTEQNKKICQNKRNITGTVKSPVNGVLNDFNTLVTEMTRMIVMAQPEFPADEPAGYYLKKALQIARQSKAIMHQFHKYENETLLKGDTEIRSKGKERILFVDIEEAGAEVSKLILEHLGYQTNAVSDPEKALAAFRSNPDRFDLVITDMTLPKMSGETLAYEILKIRPDIPIILCSTGYRQPQVDVKSGHTGIAALLIKPLVMSEIAQTVRNVLDQSNLNQQSV